MDTKVKEIHVFVEFNRHKIEEVDFDTPEVTGKQIKTKAHVPADDQLAQRVDGKLELVNDDQTVTIKDGDRFVVLPPGTIS